MRHHKSFSIFVLSSCHIPVVLLTWPFSPDSATVYWSKGGPNRLRNSELFRAWGRILTGHQPSMSIEITRRCPLSCPGCYAFSDSHLGAVGSLRQMVDFEGEELIRRTLALVDAHRPLHLSIVGGEPLVRYREITELLPALEHRGVHTQIVTSAVRPIPTEWKQSRKLNIVVSIDGLQPEHDKRRSPATYERILRHIQGHSITVHCTVTRQMTRREGYLRDFAEFWTPRPEVRKIWMSLYTPQMGEASEEMLPAEVRVRVIDELSQLRDEFPKLELPSGLLSAYRTPPPSPRRCVFALTTQTISADLKTVVKPCQLGGKPDCAQCGCIASAALEAVNRHRLPLGIRTGTIYDISRGLGLWFKSIKERLGFTPPRLANATHDRIGRLKGTLDPLVHISLLGREKSENSTESAVT
jgi:organic radical activating enzyme